MSKKYPSGDFQHTCRYIICNAEGRSGLDQESGPVLPCARPSARQKHRVSVQRAREASHWGPSHPSVGLQAKLWLTVGNVNQASPLPWTLCSKPHWRDNLRETATSTPGCIHTGSGQQACPQGVAHWMCGGPATPGQEQWLPCPTLTPGHMTLLPLCAGSPCPGGPGPGWAGLKYQGMGAASSGEHVPGRQRGGRKQTTCAEAAPLSHSTNL